jgi:hypothetical protein
MWQHDLYLALDASKRVVALLSPHYLQLQICIEEYNIVVLRDRQDRSDVLFPVLIEPTRLHSYMQLRQYVDCCLRDTEKLVSMCRLLVRQLDLGHA